MSCQLCVPDFVRSMVMGCKLYRNAAWNHCRRLRKEEYMYACYNYVRTDVKIAGMT